MPNIGPLELAIVLGIVLIIFGPKRLPGLGRQLGSGMKEFKDSITGDSKHDDDDGDTEKASIAKAEHQAAEVTRERTQDPVAGEKTSDAEAALGGSGSGDRH